MSEQRQHEHLIEGPGPHAGGDEAAASGDRLAGARAELDQVYAAADAILDRIRLGNSARLLAQIRQSGGQ